MMCGFRGAFCGTLVALALAKTLKAMVSVVGASMMADIEWDAFAKAVRGVAGSGTYAHDSWCNADHKAGPEPCPHPMP